jgi:hypothetical protein
LEDRDTIAVIASGAVSDRTLIHELTHALQEQRWGPLRTPKTFAEQYVQTTWLEREAVIVENAFAGARWTSGLTGIEDFPDQRPPAHYWFNEDPSRRSPHWEFERDQFKGEGWQFLPPGRPRGPRLTGAGAREPRDQSLGRRGTSWWTEGVMGRLVTGFSGYDSRGRGFWYRADRLRVQGNELVWRIRCDESWTSAVADALVRARPGLDVHLDGQVVVIRIPLPGRGWRSPPD